MKTKLRTPIQRNPTGTLQFKTMAIIGCLSMMLMSCGLLESKSNGNSRNRNLPLEESTGTEDAVADEGEPAAKPPVDEAPVDPAMALTGKDLYAKLCASCHGKFEESDLGKTQINKLNMAIANVPDMAGLKDSTETDLKAVVAALSELPPGKGKGKAAEDVQE